MRFVHCFSDVVRIFCFVRCNDYIVYVTDPISFSTFCRWRGTFVFAFDRGIGDAFNSLNGDRVVIFAISDVERAKEVYSFFLCRCRLFNVLKFYFMVVMATYCNMANFFRGERSTQDLFIIRHDN